MPGGSGTGGRRARSVAIVVAVIFVIIVALALRWPHVAGQQGLVPRPAPAAAASSSGAVLMAASPHTPVPLPHNAGAYEWQLKALQAQQLFEHSEGTGIKVAVVDTGIDGSNPDLTSAVAGGAKNRDFSSDSHGTEIAGLIAGRGIDRMIGLAPGAELLNIQVADNQDHVTVRDLVNGIKEAAGDGAQIINVSIGVYLASGDAQDQQAIQDAVNDAWNGGHGALVVASAGPQVSDGSMMWPAAGSNVIAVGANGSNGKPAIPLLSSYGPHDLYAPGENLFSTAEVSQGSSYAPGLTGDGFAAASVSATAALIWAGTPGYNDAQRVWNELVGPGDGPRTLIPIQFLRGVPFRTFPPLGTPAQQVTPSGPSDTATQRQSAPAKNSGSATVGTRTSPPNSGSNRGLSPVWIVLWVVLGLIAVGGGTGGFLSYRAHRASRGGGHAEADFDVDLEWHGNQ